jgi:hypothetical protein
MADPTINNKQRVQNLINEAHRLWTVIDNTDNPAVIKSTFGQIIEAEKLIKRLRAELNIPETVW